jgi:hypothetical protein
MSSKYFAIIEVEDGMAIIECDPQEDLQAVALGHRGTVIDPGPFPSYDAAYDELLNLEANEDEESIG